MFLRGWHVDFEHTGPSNSTPPAAAAEVSGEIGARPSAVRVILVEAAKRWCLDRSSGSNPASWTLHRMADRRSR